MSLSVKIVTPSALSFEGQAAEVVVPGWSGQYGVLPNHANMLTLSKPGLLTLRQDITKTTDEDEAFLIGKGFVEISNSSLTILVELCERLDDIDVEAAKTSLSDSENELADLKSTDPKASILKSKIELAKARINAVQ
ncbi:MAG: ATP synthase F1 subunit epsilon [Proteobacteria bacterium]|nr:ATP synthase F1 subunit epsilon [Pseudomonadota bacterium]|tara:strand:- start:35 stop:445 length:411 start_codon:yes stop_codon:yes gene_type:complete